MLKNKMESYVRIGGRSLKNFTYPYMGVGGVKNCQNHPYIINECPPPKINGIKISYVAIIKRQNLIDMTKEKK